MEAARADVGIAARCELALLGIAHPTIEQTAGAILRAHHADDTRFIRTAYEK